MNRIKITSLKANLVLRCSYHKFLRKKLIFSFIEKLLLYLNAIYPLSAGLIEHLQAILKVKELPKKAYLLKQGTVCTNISFIEQGLLRCFYDKDDKEVCSWFMKEGDVIISVESFFKQTVSYENIRALEECTLHYINYNELQYIFHHSLNLISLVVY